MGFARMTMHLLPTFEDVVLEPLERGLKLVATDETALAVPRDVIRQIHAGDVKFEAPQVRFLYGDVIQEPIMWVRVSVRRTYVEDVIQDLVLRGGEIEEVDWLAAPPVVRARVRLQRLLGYPQALAALSHGTSELRMWLSHYAPVPPDPGNAA
jgi:translation elongation factor EF-G